MEKELMEVINQEQKVNKNMKKRKLIYIVILFLLSLISYLFYFQNKIASVNTFAFCEGYKISGDFLSFRMSNSLKLSSFGRIYHREKHIANVLILVPYSGELIIRSVETGEIGYYLNIQEFTEN